MRIKKGHIFINKIWQPKEIRNITRMKKHSRWYSRGTFPRFTIQTWTVFKPIMKRIHTWRTIMKIFITTIMCTKFLFLNQASSGTINNTFNPKKESQRRKTTCFVCLVYLLMKSASKPLNLMIFKNYFA